jgi:hypothetical protein
MSRRMVYSKDCRVEVREERHLSNKIDDDNRGERDRESSNNQREGKQEMEKDSLFSGTQVNYFSCAFCFPLHYLLSWVFLVSTLEQRCMRRCQECLSRRKTMYPCIVSVLLVQPVFLRPRESTSLSFLTTKSLVSKESWSQPLSHCCLLLGHPLFQDDMY